MKTGLRSSLAVRVGLVAAGLLLGVSAEARADVVIGVAGPMSGAFAPVGEAMRVGVEAAVQRLNDAGGIAGERIVVEVLDDKCEGETGAAVANQFVGRGAVLVVGHACTAAALPAAEVYAENEVVMISPAASNPRFTDERVGPGIFRMAARSDQQPMAIAAYLTERFGDRRVAFVHDGSVYGQGLVDAARQAFEGSGGSAVMTESFTPGERSQNALIGQIQDAAVSAVVVGGLQADTALIASELRRRGLDAAVIGGEALALDEFRDLAGEAGEGVAFAIPRDWREVPDAASIVGAFRQDGLEPTGPVLPAYAAVQAYAQAVEAAGGLAFGPVVEALSSQGFDTVVGPVSFDEKGDLEAAGYEIHRWQEGEPVPIE